MDKIEKWMRQTIESGCTEFETPYELAVGAMSEFGLFSNDNPADEIEDPPEELLEAAKRCMSEK